MPLPYQVSEKLVISGNVVEHYQYEKPYWVGFPVARSFRVRVRTRKKEQSSIRDDNVRRAKQKIRRLINCNSDLDRFFTITFADNVTDLDIANKEFNKFIKRVNRLFPSFKYLAVPEFQKRGAVHYHLLCNLPFIDVNKLTDLWGNGFCFLRKIDKVDNVGAYVCKYLSKEIFDKRYFRKRKFFYSLNLLRPVVVDNLKDVKSILANIPLKFVKKFFSFSVCSDWLGMVQYRQMKLLNFIKVDDFILNGYY